MENGWTIGTHAEFDSYDSQDNADSQSMYNSLETKIIPTYYDQDKNGISKKWVNIMKASIITTGGKYSTARMLVDYTNNLYIPLCDLTKKYYNDVDNVAEFSSWKNELFMNWKDIKIVEKNNVNEITLDAGNSVEVNCTVKLPNIKLEDIEPQVYYGKILDNGIFEEVEVIPMTLVLENIDKKEYNFSANINLVSGGNYGYTFRVVPKTHMLLDHANLDLVKWI